jgi:hypothetical protein
MNDICVFPCGHNANHDISIPGNWQFDSGELAVWPQSWRNFLMTIGYSGRVPRIEAAAETANLRGSVRHLDLAARQSKSEQNGGVPGILIGLVGILDGAPDIAQQVIVVVQVITHTHAKT